MVFHPQRDYHIRRLRAMNFRGEIPLHRNPLPVGYGEKAADALPHSKGAGLYYKGRTAVRPYGS